MNDHVEIVKAQKTGLFTNYIFKAIPLAFDESMSYYECLCGLLDYLKNTIIPVVNNNGDAVIELQNNVDTFEENTTSDINTFKDTVNNTVEELETYMNNYFDNLDVQEEVNNKLDEMVENGTMDALLNTNLTGSLSNLDTTDKSNLVNAINEVNTNIGDLSNLDTTNKSNLINAINEVNTNIGDLSNLDTTDKTDIVSAINEVKENASNSTVYSLNEIAVGKWIDNKTLYRKVIRTNSLYPNDSQGNLILPHGITNLDKVVKINCIAHNSNTYDYLLPGFYNFDNYCWFSTSVGDTAPKDLFNVFVNDTNIVGHYNAHTLLEADDVYFILEYTKNET